MYDSEAFIGTIRGRRQAEVLRAFLANEMALSSGLRTAPDYDDTNYTYDVFIAQRGGRKPTRRKIEDAKLVLKVIQATFGN